MAVKDTDWPLKENLPLLGKSIMSPPHMSPAVNLYTCSPTDKVVHRRSPLDWMHQYDVISNGRNINRCNKIFTVYKEDNNKIIFPRASWLFMLSATTDVTFQIEYTLSEQRSEIPLQSFFWNWDCLVNDIISQS